MDFDINITFTIVIQPFTLKNNMFSLYSKNNMQVNPLNHPHPNYPEPYNLCSKYQKSLSTTPLISLTHPMWQ